MYSAAPANWARDACHRVIIRRLFHNQLIVHSTLFSERSAIAALCHTRLPSLDMYRGVKIWRLTPECIYCILGARYQIFLKIIFIVKIVIWLLVFLQGPAWKNMDPSIFKNPSYQDKRELTQCNLNGYGLIQLRSVENLTVSFITL